MRVTVKLFGPEATACGVSEIDVEVADSATSNDVLRALASACPQLRDSIGSLRLAINHQFAGPGQLIAPSDELAAIGLVSGG